jgi:hypothetical protein
MNRISTNTRRELVGALSGGIIGAPIAWILHSTFQLPPAFSVANITTVFAVITGTFVRRKLGWLLLGAALGAMIADLLFSRPKFQQAAELGLVPGAFVGLVLMIGTDVLKNRQVSEPLPAEKHHD